MFLRYVLVACVAAGLTACATLPGNTVAPAAVFVVVGVDGAATVRAVVTDAQCPAVTFDGVATQMAVRSPLSAIAARTPQSTPVAVQSCEMPVPAGTRQATLAGQALPLPVAQPKRIVVIGDTGCRLNGNANQDCNDPEAYPFATVAASAAAWHPDLVIHVGDYHYRESPCLPGKAGCAGSPYGYGWSAWEADFFAPGKALFAAAPWVMTRGNHETCARAGQGWWRFLDPHPLVTNAACEGPAGQDGDAGDYTDPYAVPLGDGLSLVVFDSANTSYTGFKPGDPRIAIYGDMVRKIAFLAQRTPSVIAVDHHPLFGIGALEKDGKVTLYGGDAGLLQAFGPLAPRILPDNVQMLLSGHIHLWEQVSYASGHPTQFISGFAGTLEDIVPLPERPPAGLEPAPGAIVSSMSSWIDGFGFMTMERTGADTWNVQVHDRAGVVRNTCSVQGKTSQCETAQVHN
jgi:hypothetical protein